MTLQDICRVSVRRILRHKIKTEHPESEKRVKRKPKRKPPKSRSGKHRRINIVPLNMGMMILGK